MEAPQQAHQLLDEMWNEGFFGGITIREDANGAIIAAVGESHYAVLLDGEREDYERGPWRKREPAIAGP